MENWSRETTPTQWAFARVNSMLTGGKADPDLQAKIKSGGYKKKKKKDKNKTKHEKYKTTWFRDMWYIIWKW